MHCLVMKETVNIARGVASAFLPVQRCGIRPPLEPSEAKDSQPPVLAAEWAGDGPQPSACQRLIKATIGPLWVSVSAIAKSRIDPELKRQAEAVLEEIGLKPRAALELFYKQIVKRRAIPFPVQADSPEDEVLSPAARRNALADEF